MDHADDVDVDAEADLEHDTTNGSPNGNGGMTLVSDAVSLAALGVPRPVVPLPASQLPRC